jgi:ElaB/YqjD/DUF883 family membrane-anchored ribosome-binding protein
MDNIQKIMGTVVKDGNNIAERVDQVTDTALEKGRQTWKELSAQSKEVMANAQKSTQEAWEDAQQLVQKHPGKAIGIALLVGAAVGAIGALLSFRNND